MRKIILFFVKRFHAKWSNEKAPRRKMKQWHFRKNKFRLSARVTRRDLFRRFFLDLILLLFVARYPMKCMWHLAFPEDRTLDCFPLTFPSANFVGDLWTWLFTDYSTLYYIISTEFNNELKITFLRRITNFYNFDRNSSISDFIDMVIIY